MAIVYLSFGSNLGNRLKNFKLAEELLEQFGINFLKWSSVYESEPVCQHPDDKDQPWFYDAVAQVKTDHNPTTLLLLCQEVERRLGRTQKSILENGKLRYQPRPIDIDILLYDDHVIDTSVLQVPHPRFHKRRYDLVPLCELSQNLNHPILKKSMKQLLQACPDSSKVRLPVNSVVQ